MTQFRDFRSSGSKVKSDCTPSSTCRLGAFFRPQGNKYIETLRFLLYRFLQIRYIQKYYLVIEISTREIINDNGFWVTSLCTGHNSNQIMLTFQWQSFWKLSILVNSSTSSLWYLYKPYYSVLRKMHLVLCVYFIVLKPDLCVLLFQWRGQPYT